MMNNTVTLYKCDSCKKVITEPVNGLVIHGNIYVADPNNRGGLIGNNFPMTKDDSTSTFDSVKETVMCVPCFLDACLPNHKLSVIR